MLRTLLAALLIAMAGPALPQDTLDRLTLRQDLLGWEGVGRLELGGGAYCTGVLISSDTVLTAAHCLWDPRRGTWRTRESVSFRAGLRDGVSVAERDALQAVVHPGYRFLAADPVRRYQTDVALVRLAGAIPAATARPFRVTAPGTSGEVSVASYGAGRDGALSRQRRCNVLGRQAGLFVFDCDGVPGSSGAPVFRIDGSAIRVVSIIAGGTAGDGRPLSVGPELTAAVAELERAARSGAGIWAEPEPQARRVRPDGARDAGGARFVRP